MEYWMYTDPITKKSFKIELLVGFWGAIIHWLLGSAWSNNPDSMRLIIYPSTLRPIQSASFLKGLLRFCVKVVFLILFELLRLLLSLTEKGSCFWWTVFVIRVSALILSC